MHKKINIYQVMPRIWGNTKTNLRLNGTYSENGCGTLADFSTQALQHIASLGCNYIWYTGIIEHASKTSLPQAERHTNPSLVKGEAGSPYAILDYYNIHPTLCQDPATGLKEFKDLIKRSHQAKLQVIIDFVPNHVARQYKATHRPKGRLDLGEKDDTTHSFHPQNNFYYIVAENLQLQIGLSNDEINYSEQPAKATGNDCFHAFPNSNDWYETIKLNYGINYQDGTLHADPIPDTWTKMLDILLFWSKLGVDGFRCDMVHMVPVAFWQWAIHKVKEQYKNMLFIGELYEQALYRPYIEVAGFDYLYDKIGLYDTLRLIIQEGYSARAITNNWQRNEGIGQRMLHFMENHDEQRIASTFFACDAWKGVPAMMVSAWLNSNATLLYFGQELGETGMQTEGYSGCDGRTSIFDYCTIDKIMRLNNNGLWNAEKLTEEERKLQQAYSDILNIALRESAIAKGAFFDLMYANPDSEYFHGEHVYTFMRKHEQELLLIVVNFSDQEQVCQIQIPQHAFDHWRIQPDHYPYKELMTQEEGFLCLNANCTVNCTVGAHYGRVFRIKSKTLNKEEK